jgi:hypothetical protein
MSDKEDLLEGGITLHYNAPSSYDLPSAVQVQAQDPEEEEVAVEEDTAPADAPADAAEEDVADEAAQEDTGPSEDEMLDEIENSPGAQWKKYLRPILKMIKDTNLMVPIELRNSYAIGVDDDTLLGFHITGVVHFLDDIPEDVAAQLKGEVLRYDATITPDGTIGDVDLVYPTLKPPYEPIFRINRNVDSL